MPGPITAFIDSRLRAFERRYQYDIGYARHVLRAGLRPFAVFCGAFMLATHRQGVPIAPWFTAKWVAARQEDCGPCQQLVIDMGREQGMQAAMWDAIIAGDLASMTPEVALVHQWARGIVTTGHDMGQLSAWRQQIVDNWGERGLVSLALAMAGGRSFPLIKRALGQHHACQILRTGSPHRTGTHA